MDLQDLAALAVFKARRRAVGETDSGCANPELARRRPRLAKLVESAACDAPAHDVTPFLRLPVPTLGAQRAERLSAQRVTAGQVTKPLIPRVALRRWKAARCAHLARRAFTQASMPCANASAPPLAGCRIAAAGVAPRRVNCSAAFFPTAMTVARGYAASRACRGRRPCASSLSVGVRFVRGAPGTKGCIGKAFHMTTRSAIPSACSERQTSVADGSVNGLSRVVSRAAPASSRGTAPAPHAVRW